MKQGDVLIVTGAAGALGGAMVERFAGEGMRAVGIDLSYERGPIAPESGGASARVGADLADALEVERAFAQIESELGPIAGVVHCAGGFRWSRLIDLGDDDLDFLMRANLRSSILVARASLARMIPRAYGRVLLIGSRSTLGPGAGEGAYAATKAGINALVRASAAELGGTSCTINALLPAIIDTPANRAAMPDADHRAWVSTDQLAAIASGFFGSWGDPINGALLPIAGRTGLDH